MTLFILLWRLRGASIFAGSVPPSISVDSPVARILGMDVPGHAEQWQFARYRKDWLDSGFYCSERLCRRLLLRL